MLNAIEIMELQKLAGIDKFRKLTVKQYMDREKLIELIRCADFSPTKGAVATIGSRFTTEFIEAVADHLIANGVTVQQWIPVKERLPKEGETVLAFGYWHEKFQPLCCYLSPHHKGEWFTNVAGQQVYEVTHWIPLPETPMEVQK